jgi:hypothetical protein
MHATHAWPHVHKLARTRSHTRARSPERAGKQDPYCILTVGLVSQRSREHTDGGRNPVWNQDISFPRVKREDVLFIQVRVLYVRQMDAHARLCACACVRPSVHDHPCWPTASYLRG